jgi:membrane-associated phospholipid phosphatase
VKRQLALNDGFRDSQVTATTCRNTTRGLTLFLFILYSAGASGQNLDIDILRQINQGKSESADNICRGLSNSVAPLAIATPVFFFVRSIARKDTADKVQSIFFASSLVVTTVVVSVSKVAFQRDRPFDTHPFIEQKTSAPGYSFPSGHTAAAFQLATSLTIACPRWYVIVPAYTWASAVGYSRMELGVHYPSDVLAGAVIGAGSAILSHKLTLWVNRKRKR